MEKEVSSFKEEIIIKLIPICDNPDNKSLALFAWSFKRKSDALDELLKHKAHLCTIATKQIHGTDY